MRATTFRLIMLASAACYLSACGGGGIEVASTPPPPTSAPAPTPTPTSTPTPNPYLALAPVKIFPAVTASTDFATLGIETSVGGAPISSLTRNGFSARYDASSGLYILGLPSAQPDGFYNFSADQPNTQFWRGRLADSETSKSPEISVFKPSPANTEIQLTYTTFANYNIYHLGGPPFGLVAFGQATAQSNIPLTGAADYLAKVAGTTVDGMGEIQGSAALRFDFGAGTLSGHFDPVYYDITGLGSSGQSLGRYDFVNTVFGVGSSSFSGSLSKPSNSQTGTFDGLFTGPNAQELMSRWTLLYINPAMQTVPMFGVWVGKKN